MERNRRLSLCACAHTLVDTVSGSKYFVQGRSCTWCRGSRTGWRWRRKLRLRRRCIRSAAPVRGAQISRAGCSKICRPTTSPDSNTSKAGTDGHSTKARDYSAHRTSSTCLGDCGCRNRCGNRWRRHRRSRTRFGWWNWIRNRHGHRELDWPWYWRWTGYESSAYSDSILSPAAPRTPIAEGLPPDCVVRCR